MAQTYEEWWRGVAENYYDRDPSLAASSAWTAAQYALNTELGIAGNETAKAARLEVAMAEFDTWDIDGNIPPHVMREIIKKAQG